MSTQAAASGTSTPFRLGYRPSLDGLRGLSIIAVMGLHANLFFMSGGFLGVQVFFVLSGFLITALLLGERQARGGVSLRHFYIRRALRLLPAVCALLIAGAAYALLYPDRVGTQDYVRDALATLFYVANWLYASVGLQPHILVHTWSLSIEEQFYLAWPLITVLLLRRYGKQSVLFNVAAGGAAAAAIWRLFLLEAVHSSVDRMYFGLDTRADALLIGCALGVAAAWGRLPQSRRWHQFVTIAAYGGAGVLVLAVVRISRYNVLLYRGGFTVVAVATVAIIAHLVLSPEGFAAKVLSIKPLVWLGKVSYGLYLWHWPVFAVVHEANLGLRRPVEIAFEVAISLVITAASFYFLEQPCLRLKDRFGRPDGGTKKAGPAEAEPALS